MSCDINCQRKQNVNRLRELYNKEVDNYYKSYNQYLEYKSDTSPDSSWKKNYAETTLRPQVETINTRLNSVLEELKKNIQSIESQIKSQEREVTKYNENIQSKIGNIQQLNQQIEEYRKELTSKDRQVMFTEERHKYRKIMIIALVIVNIILLCASYIYFFNKSK